MTREYIEVGMIIKTRGNKKFLAVTLDKNGIQFYNNNTSPIWLSDYSQDLCNIDFFTGEHYSDEDIMEVYAPANIANLTIDEKINNHGELLWKREEH